MDESTTTKGLKLTGSDADIQESSIRRIVVEGYDTSLPWEDVDDALREHFGSCGNIIHLYIPRDLKTGILNRFALIYVGGEAEEDKALRLDGSEMGGHILVVKAYPFQENHLDGILAPMKNAYKLQSTMEVIGYDTSLSEDHVKNMLMDHFSSCRRVSVIVLDRTALVYVIGEEAVEKALKLSGNRLGIVVARVFPEGKPEDVRCGDYAPPIDVKAVLTEEQQAGLTFF